LFELLGTHVGIQDRVVEAFLLDLSGGEDAGAHGLAVGAAGFAGELGVGDGRDFDVNVDAVEKGAGEFVKVAIALAGVVRTESLSRCARCLFATSP
jgi:hypothetical protein